jgi:hypothetical protein
MHITHVGGGATADSLRYVIEASGYGVDSDETVTYVFECHRRPDGSSVLTLTTGDGEIVATATRTADGAVNLLTASGFTKSSTDGTLTITAEDREHLTLAEWAILDASIFSWYEIPPEAEDPNDMRMWRDGLTLVDTLEPVAEQEAGLLPRTLLPVAYAFWEDAYTEYELIDGGVALRIRITCIPF